jgi:glucose-6-phosphate 1-epimerase
VDTGGGGSGHLDEQGQRICRGRTDPWRHTHLLSLVRSGSGFWDEPCPRLCSTGALVPPRAEDGDGASTLTFRLTNSDVAGLPSVQFWPHPFELTYTVTFGADLAIDLAVRNSGEKAYSFEEALHTYFAVKDIADAAIEGLDGLQFLDRAPNAPTEPAPQVGAVTFTDETDRVYSSVGASAIVDPAGRRVITVAKDRSANTVVWNPWSAKAAAMPDFGDDEWTDMVCVETANVLQHAVTLGAGDLHTMSTRYSVSHPS